MATSLRDMWDADLERAVVGAVLCGGAARYGLLARHVRPGDFWLDGYGALWRLMGQMPVVDYLAVSRAARAGGLAQQGIDEVDLARCVNEWSYRSGALVDAGFEVDGALVSPDDLAVMLARRVHGLATCRRAGMRLQDVLRRALGYDPCTLKEVSHEQA
jgi:ABC-type nitrate/sulfonate/bicarbonate transport system substrate-binding protein